MSKFKDYSLPELYANTNLGPQNTAQVNWKSVAIYGGIAVGTAIVIAIVINQGTKIHVRQFQVHSEKMNQRFIEALEIQEERIAKLTAQVAATEAKKQNPEKEVHEENSNQA